MSTLRLCCKYEAWSPQTSALPEGFPPYLYRQIIPRRPLWWVWEESDVDSCLNPENARGEFIQSGEEGGIECKQRSKSHEWVSPLILNYFGSHDDGAFFVYLWYLKNGHSR